MLSPCTKLDYLNFAGIVPGLDWTVPGQSMAAIFLRRGALVHLNTDENDECDKERQDDGLLPVVYTTSKHLPSEGLFRDLLILVLRLLTSILH